MIVEPDGQWHTADNKYGSAAWRAVHPPIKDPIMTLPPTPVKQRSPTPDKAPPSVDAPAKSGPSNAEIVILDSDDEEEGQVKRELSVSASHSLNTSSASIGSQPPRSQTVESDVIDLTLDSDDEDTLVSAPPSKKRKSDERDIASPTESIWKKSRLDLSPAAHSTTPIPYVSSSSYSPPSRDPIRDPRILAPPSPSRYSSTNHATRHTTQPYTSTYIPPGGAPVPARPPLPIHPPHPYLSPPSSSTQWRI